MLRGGQKAAGIRLFSSTCCSATGEPTIKFKIATSYFLHILSPVLDPAMAFYK